MLIHVLIDSGELDVSILSLGCWAKVILELITRNLKRKFLGIYKAQELHVHVEEVEPS